jgi:hypothetical protein
MQDLFSVNAGRLDMVQILLDAKDNPAFGLKQAILGKHTDIVRLLLASSATLGPWHAKAIRSLSEEEKSDMGLL